VIEENADIIESLRAGGIEVIAGPAAPAVLLEAANIQAARWLFLAIPNAFEAGQYAQQARIANPAVTIIARAHTDAEVEHLQSLGASITIMAERETARAMVNVVFTGTSDAGPDVANPAAAGA
jgi:CPA2 family monovalent cation:H+ antiporter-2